MATKKDEMKKLQAENARLKSELKQAKESSKVKKGFNWKSFGKWASLSLAGALFVAGSILFYVGLTLTNTDRFMNVASPLIRQPAVQQAVAQKTTTELFNQVNTDEIVTEVLPDKVDFLAPQISKQIEKATEQKAQDVLASSSFQNTWDSTLRSAHARLVTGLKNYEGDGTININDVYNKLSERLSDTKASFLTGKTLPSNIGNITIIQADWLPVAHKVVANITLARILTILLFFALLALSVVLSVNRRRAMQQVGLLIAILSLILLVSLRIAGKVITNHAATEYQEAASQTWHVFVNPFVIQLYGELLFGLALAFIAWVGGASKAASNFRHQIETVLAGQLHRSAFKKENTLTKWVGKRKAVLLIALSVIYACSFLLITISLASVLIVTVFAAIIALLVETIAES